MELIFRGVLRGQKANPIDKSKRPLSLAICLQSRRLAPMGDEAFNKAANRRDISFSVISLLISLFELLIKIA